MIAVFDSGVGGISVLAELVKQLPNESFYYYADCANAPYGGKSKQEIIELMKGHCDRFINMGCKAIVLGCNTATSAASAYLREKYELPIVGIEPAIKPALLKTDKRVLVLATELTIKEDKLRLLADSLNACERLILSPCPGLMELVEAGCEEKECNRYLYKLISPYINQISAIVLGCTHYSFLKRNINILFPEAELFDGNLGVAKHLKELLLAKSLLNTQANMQICFDNSLEGRQREEYSCHCRLLLKKYFDVSCET